MDLKKYLAPNNTEDELPLDNIPSDGGFCGIFRTIGCVGDSLSSGEFESTDENGNKGYHDYFEYSWGQYIARMTGSKVWNFSRGGMTASEYCDSFAEANHFWDEDKLCRCYIIALGANDLGGQNQPVGSTADIDTGDCERNAKTFAGYYAKIIQRLKKLQPKARFFLMTFPRESEDGPSEKGKQLSELLYSFAEFFDYTYVLDIGRYGPVYDAEFKRNYYLGGHLNPMGYMLTAKLTAAYIDYIVRHNPEDFAQTGFIGTDFHNHGAKW